MAKAKFVLNRKGVREELLLSEGSVPVEEALYGIAESVKPAGATSYVNRSYGPDGRVVIWIVADEQEGTRGAKGARLSLQAALNKIGGRFRKGGGRKA